MSDERFAWGEDDIQIIDPGEEVEDEPETATVPQQEDTEDDK